MSKWLAKWTPIQLWLALAAAIALLKCLQFAVDHQTVFFSDSGAFILNGLGIEFLPERSFVYGYLLRLFAMPFHHLEAIVALQSIMGGCTAWLLAFVLIRYFDVRPWIAASAALLFVLDPVQVVYEHLVMTETAAALAGALYLVTAFACLRRPSWQLLTLLSLWGIVLTGLRVVYVPVSIAASILFPLFLALPVKAYRLRLSMIALSFGTTIGFHIGYRQLVGVLAHREPAYHYRTGEFLIATTSSILRPEDADDSRVAAAIVAQSQSGTRLIDSHRAQQIWSNQGLVAKLKAIYTETPREMDPVARRLAFTALRRDPAGFALVAARLYKTYWRSALSPRYLLEYEDGSLPPRTLARLDLNAIQNTFGVDVDLQSAWRTPSRNFHQFAGRWYLFLLAAPFLVAVALLWHPIHPRPLAVLLLWCLLLLAATCFGSPEAVLRYLHPFSFPSLAAAAILSEKLTARREA